MKKRRVAIIILIICINGVLYADDYKWDYINALIKNDYTNAEKIIKRNINTMSAAEKRLLMLFTLTYSSGDNTAKVIYLLLGYNILPNSYDLYTAINRNQPDTVIQLLQDNGAKPNGEILLLSMEKKRFDLAKQFIETGVDVNYQYPLSKNYADGMTPLLYASKWNNFELVKLLLEHGANINAKAKDGNTALTTAQTNGNTLIYNYLIEQGAGRIGNNGIPPPQNAGIASIFDNRIINFKLGTYRIYGGNIDLKFAGNTNSGNVNYIKNGITNTGVYRIEGNNITITIEGKPYLYKMDSDISFSGNGETWIRTGN